MHDSQGKSFLADRTDSRWQQQILSPFPSFVGKSDQIAPDCIIFDHLKRFRPYQLQSFLYSF